MKITRILICLSIFCLTCGCETTSLHKTNSKKMTVRLTTYSRDEKLPKKHPDKWSKKGISSTGIPLKNMCSAAVDPKIIPYNSLIRLPCLNHLILAQDTGSWVKSRRASTRLGYNYPVIDLFFDKEKDAASFRRKTPLFMEVIVYNNYKYVETNFFK
jgi:3D (Asp-Asp-Asp) domain-containing protein